MNNNQSFIRKENILDYYQFEDEEEEERMGTTSIVKKAINLKNENMYGVKCIYLKDLLLDKEKIFSEINILQNLHHPNIVNVHEVFVDEEEEFCFIVLEWMEGGGLFDRIYNCHDEMIVKEIFRKLVDGVRYCHKLGIVHRDLKPENILYKSYDNTSDIKISDFGVAKYFNSIDNNNKLYSAVGTPSYTAPEVIIGKGYNEKCDIWSLGIILYIMLCGYLPFSIKEDEPLEILYDKISKGSFSFPEKEWKNISNKAKEVIKKLLIINPNNRPSAEMILEFDWFD